MGKDFRVDDESGDKNYFTMVPNYVLNHSGAIEQALYLNMKRHAGEHGSCYASGKTLRKKLKIGVKAYRKAIQYLLEHEWIYYKGQQLMDTAGGQQMVPVYGIRDLWKINHEHYHKGGAERAPLPKGVLKDTKGVLKVTQGGAESAPKKNLRKTQEKENFYFDEETKTMRPIRAADYKPDFLKHEKDNS